ncbi:CerR family C-terminal domain-containing protein [Trinickia caryophylli]|uniref:Transcriptional regulator, TetR family n=1 Tax=Trinickia caryophylli TaxID=28094 RepID=A0A1X7F1V2_TRICW|nr:CerR family C-terminal domain-containing protein [Trinickia caryophylli]PMS10366.1 DUF1956 domain-containing protein [Trinickia caryophylli]TRX19511.1 DUF1956 domain-containing protein [Trinickia caryophylli]WQE13178.1 CerR family C-terminal domain-containing protein [Trinickia caryophylli]SMF44406.1 transcriptional regulator, TetR family [Trinickia caryophylli]GLU34517.1 transcriptional regulator [Trinickia caryophylli]
MSEAKRLRRPAEGGYARGDETRLRIVAAAIDVFGERGFAAASTREIAARAGVNAPALQYYFDNKEGVYRACAEEIAEHVRARFEPVLQRVRDVLADEDADDERLIGAYLALLEAVADKVFLTPHTPGTRLFFVREQMGQEPVIASQILHERLREPLNQIGSALASRIGGTAPDDPVTRIRMMGLHGQLAIFQMAPRTTLTMLGWDQFDADRIALVKSTLLGQTRTLLTMWARERDARVGDTQPAARAKRATGATRARKR